jgi:hypothetical protein
VINGIFFDVRAPRQTGKPPYKAGGRFIQECIERRFAQERCLELSAPTERWILERLKVPDTFFWAGLEKLPR